MLESLFMLFHSDSGFMFVQLHLLDGFLC